MKHILRECLTGGVAASGACLFTNPLEVVKTRMQLQGELQIRGTYPVFYRNVFHASYTIIKVEGVAALQKGLAPALLYQLCMNGVRLGSFEVMNDMKLTQNKNGEVSFINCCVAGGLAGSFGAFFASPVAMLKVQAQSQTNSTIKVGAQHKVSNVTSMLSEVYRKNGISGLWRGSSAATLRVTIGSCVQLSSFTWTKNIIIKNELFHPNSLLVPLSSSMIAGAFVVVAMTPLDVISTRVYNQKVNRFGSGVMYDSLIDTFQKIFKSEGIYGLYKGLGAHYFRIGPHTILSLVFWDRLKMSLKK